MYPKLWHLPQWRATAPKRPELAVIRIFDTHTDVKPPGHRHLIEASPDGILLTLQSRITYVNRAGIGLFGARDETQLIDRSFLEFFETTAPAMPQTLIQEIMAADTAARSRPSASCIAWTTRPPISSCFPRPIAPAARSVRC